MATQQPTIQLPFTTSHAFIIGINDYQHVSPLSTAVNDARKIAEQLADQHHFQVHPPLLDATHEDIQKLLSETIPKLVGEDDRVLFYFAGHGIALDGEEGPNGYLVAADTKPGQEATLIPMMDLHDALTTLPCRHGLLILDCCFSGAFKWSSGYRDVVFDMPKVIYEERFWRYCKDPAWQVITSAAHDQKAVDRITNQSLGLREEGDGENSPFATSLLRALEGEGDVIPAGAGDGVMTATELYSYLRDSVETKTTENAKRQSPSIFNLQRHDKGEFIFLHPNHRFNLPPTPDRNPFMGLRTFKEEDAHLFFGRERVVQSLLNKVLNKPLTVISGASGSGKSSLMEAGLLPLLRQQEYKILPIFRPSEHPLQTIPKKIPDVNQQMAAGPTLLIVDQYEEFLQASTGEEERLAFEQQIAVWLRQYPELRIIFSVRSDFEAQLKSEVLAKWWQAGHYQLPPFSLDETREVITRPATQAVLFYEPIDLVEKLSEEAQQSPGAVPMLSHTLSELYQAYLKSGRQDRALIKEDYQQLDGLAGVLCSQADTLYQSLNTDEQNSLRKLILRMVSLNGGELTGRAIYREELQFSNENETQQLYNIADKLIEGRLLHSSADRLGQAYLEPAHDALISQWKPVREWVESVGKDKINLQDKLSRAVSDYRELQNANPQKAHSVLWYNHPRISELQTELASKNHGLNALEEVFIQNSIAKRKKRRRMNWVLGSAALAAILGLVWLTNTQNLIRTQSKADRLAGLSVSTELSNPTHATRIAELALEVQPENINALGALLNAYYVEESPAIEYLYQIEDEPPVIPNEAKLAKSRALAEQNFAEYNNKLTLEGQPPIYFNWESTYTPSHNGSLILWLAKPNGELRNFEMTIENCYNRYKTFSYTIEHANLRNPEVEFHLSSFSLDDLKLLVPNGAKAESWQRERLADWKHIHDFCASEPLRWAVYDEEPLERVVALSTQGTHYSWKTNTALPNLEYQSRPPDKENITQVFCDASAEIFVYLKRGNWPVEILNRNKGIVKTSIDDQPLTFSEDDLSIYAGSEKIIDLKDFTAIFDLNDHSLRSQKSKEMYDVDIDTEKRKIRIGDKNTGEELLLDGHSGIPVSVSFDPKGQFIVSSSLGETNFWDWQGNNFYSLDYGGLTQILPNGKEICFWQFGSQSEFKYAAASIFLMSIDPETILDNLDKNGIYELTEAEKTQYLSQ